MKALVYLGPNKKALEDRPIPTINMPTDAVVRVEKATVCGTDIHIIKGDVSSCQPGRILGHEGTGIIDKIGSAVRFFKPGDRVLISCISACGKCAYCRQKIYSHCVTGGWMLGNKVDGTQADFVRTPYADTSLHHIPKGMDEDALVLLSDILPTGFECGVLDGKIKSGDSVAIVGAGPIGLAALLSVQRYSPKKIFVIDIDNNRLEMAKRFGATTTINNNEVNAHEKIMQLTHNSGVDTAIETLGITVSTKLCNHIIAPRGVIVNIGASRAKVDLLLEESWNRQVTVTASLVDTFSTSMLLEILRSKKASHQRLITHYFKLDSILEAYDAFTNAINTRALKVIIET